MKLKQIQGYRENDDFVSNNTKKYNKPFLETQKKKRGQRGKQKIPPSGHLAPTIQIRDGVCYPRIDSLNEEQRKIRLHNNPEEVPYWFIWLFQWTEKDPLTGFWRTRSKNVPVGKIPLIKNAIASRQGIAKILKIIES